MVASRTPAPADYRPTAPVTDQALWTRVIRHARCTGSSLDPDQWFPISSEIRKARQEAAAAITVCATCLVRAECLALSLLHWDIGQHGVWGGLVAAERAALPHRRQATLLRASAEHEIAPPRPSRPGRAASGIAGAGHPRGC